jgi:phosphoribosylformylglycinamidine synthase
MWQFTEVIDGIAEACRVLETPITGGNVSFYNETLGKPIYPTPVLGVLGLLENADDAVDSAFRNEGDVILLLDAPGPARSVEEAQREFSSSEYAKTIQGVVTGTPPAIDLGAEKRLIACLVKLASEHAIASAHDVSDGGISVTLAESCFASECLAAEVNLESAVTGEPAELAVFGERGARAVVSAPADSVARISAIAAQWNVRAERIGVVTRGQFRIKLNGGLVIEGDAGSFRAIWEKSLQGAIESE